MPNLEGATTGAAGSATSPQCQAINIHGEQRCRHIATHNNERFCGPHAKQCFDLYKGYKRRNAELDALDQKEPAFLRNAKVSLVNQNFEGLTEEHVHELQEIHTFLFKQYVLLRKVIKARKIHHQSFYTLEMDYGHQAYLDRLVSREQAVSKALENLERRSSMVIFKKEKWYDWVRKEQELDEANREMEAKKKVKLEAALFRRHWGGIKARFEAAREKEEKRRQEEYLEEVWRERMAASDDSDVDWDPIEDIYQEDREKFIDLIRHFLWMELAPVAAPKPKQQPEETPNVEGEEAEPAPKKKKARGKRKGKPQGVAPKETPSASNASVSQAKQAELDKSNIGSKDDVRKRLREGVEKKYDHIQGPLVVGSAQLPHELYKRTAPYSEEDTERLVSEIAEIKLLLFCRQLLSQPQLLPAALRANSIEEFLDDKSVADSELRDLCLKVEQPSLQSLRDACADFARGDEPDDDEEEEVVVPPRPIAEYVAHAMRYGSLEDNGRRGTGLCNDLTSLEARNMFNPERLAAGELQKEPKDQKMKIKVCGKSIWNHASQSSMPRDGWLHFSIMARNCSFPDAMSLCRNWDEFAHLHFLTGWHYFPVSGWFTWSGNLMTEELIGKGFVPFYIDGTAQAETSYNKMHRVTQRAIEACPMVVEARNMVCAYMKRNDAASRRFIQYILLSRGEALILVRDGKTGKIVVAPEENERWWRRSIPGFMGPRPGHHVSDSLPWRKDEVNANFFARTQVDRAWKLGFDSYYEVYIWDNAPGQEIESLYRLISDSLWKAHRVRGLRDKYKLQKHVIEGLTRDKQTMAVRPIRPGEQVENLYEEMTGPNVTYWVRTKHGQLIQTSEDILPGECPYLFYNESDAAEDAILFDEGLPDHFPFIEITNPLHMLETGGMSPSILNYQANVLHKTLFPETKAAPVGNALSDDSDSAWESDDDVKGLKPYAPGSEEFNYYLSPLWAQAHRKIRASKLSKEKQDLLHKLDFDSVRLQIPYSQLGKILSKLEVMERDRSYVFKDTFHLSDLEVGAGGKYDISTRLLRGIQRYVPDVPNLDWAWFCMQTLDWMNLKLHYRNYSTEPLHPWPHRYMVQDITQAFVTMALFFPDLPVTSVVHDYLKTKEGSEFKSSPIFNAVERSKQRPACRTRTSNRFRQPSFWIELEKLKNVNNKAIFEVYPMEWAKLIRPTIAKLYRGGAISPAPFSPDDSICTGLCAAVKEPHLANADMYIQYNWTKDFVQDMPANYIDYSEWPDLLTIARPFAASHPTARFALIKLWSAPHFYPLMLQIPSRLATAFLDPSGRSWQWKFLPKDMPASEWSIHNTVRLRLGCLRQTMLGVNDQELARAAKEKAAQEEEERRKNKGKKAYGKKKDKTLWDKQYDREKKEWDSAEKWKADEKWSYGHCELDERVFHRGDLVLVMGRDQEDLLRWCTAVTFALQTKPWFREVDLWKSFVNVDWGFLKGLEKWHLGYEIEEEEMPRGDEGDGEERGDWGE